MKNFSVVIIIAVFLFSCGEEIVPKPKPYLTLQYPIASYKKLKQSVLTVLKFQIEPRLISKKIAGQL